jgi:hypothetical protein
VCSTWSSILDALLPRLQPRLSLVATAGKMELKFQSVTEVDLTGCENDVCGVLAELRSMPSLPQPLAASELFRARGGR